MGGFDENGGDGMPLFSGMLGDDGGSRCKENNNNGGFSFPRQNGDGSEATKSGEQRAGLVQRMAARSGYNAPTLNTDIIRPAQNQETKSPYLTIPPGLSPTTLLDSPVFLSNSLVQPSPTTGKFQFPNGIGIGIANGRSSMMFSDSSDRSKDSFFEDFNSSSFAFKPVPDSAPFSHVPAVDPAVMFRQSFPSIEISGQTQTHIEPAKVHSQNGTSLHIQSDFSIASTEKKAEANNFSLQITPFEAVNGDAEQSQQNIEDDDDAEQRDNGYVNGGSSEDGYNWRKYGQKQVKGSEYPRSYYKCTHSNCPVKKKVERSHEGHITEIIYKGAHNHPKLSPNRRQGIGSSGALCDMVEQGGDGDPAWTTNKGNNTHWGQESDLEVLHGQRGAQLESSDAVDASSTFSNDEDDDDRATHGSVSLVCDGEEDESESKRRKVEAYAADVSGATRAIREPRVVVQTTSEVDILDDGYRWRKYGQKVVKGNPNPRSYYKCTSTGCTVRKHVERASHDLKSVITTYEGKHNHDVPAARNSSHVSSIMAPHAQSQVHRPEHSSMGRFERPVYGLPGRQQLHDYGYGMNQGGGLAHMAMAALGPPNQGKMPVHHQYLGGQMNEMGFMLPKGEPKLEPMSDPGLNLANTSSAAYHQIPNR